jgi:phosphoribosyl-dephospho-CoA transferase
MCVYVFGRVGCDVLALAGRITLTRGFLPKKPCLYYYNEALLCTRIRKTHLGSS